MTRGHDADSIGTWQSELTQPELLTVSAWTGHLPFAFWIIEALSPRVVVELGVHTGASYCGFCQAVSLLQLPSACYGVDTWEGDDHAGRYGPEVLEALRKHHDPRYGGFSRLIQSTFDAASPYFADGSIDLLHIDGLHTYGAVRHDFETWRPKLSDRAVVLFHDTNVREQQFGVWKLWDTLRSEYPHFTFLHSHGLGVLGFGSQLNPSLRDLFSLDDNGVARVRRRFETLGHNLTRIADLQRSLDDVTRTAGERDHLLKQAHAEIGRYHDALTAANQSIAKAEESAGDRSHQIEEMRAEIGRYHRALKTARQEADEMKKESIDQHARIEMLEQKLEESAHVAAPLAGPNASWSSQLFALARAAASRMRRAVFSLRRKGRGKSRKAAARLAARIPPELLDPDWYAGNNPDVVAAGIDPWKHFIKNGVREGRSPNAYFDTSWYLETNRDVADAGQNALLHYLRHGAAEGRAPHPEFDAAWYVARHPDAAANPLLHYMKIGRRQGWPTQAALDIADYLPSTRPSASFPVGCTIDVIIPAYRGLDETRRCIESVLRDRQRPDGEIIVVDDCSPEPELSHWLDDLASRGAIRLLRNQENQGFVRSVNIGMEAAGRHDVILLNSDTEVPEGWIRRLAAHAHAGPRIGTVTPFSNNATICSYPSIEGGPLPDGHSLESLDAAFRSANSGRTVALPTAVGFAMYIRRDCLDAVGLFDAETFGRGYAEENDFCMRAAAQGWDNLLACDTFVYHAGEVSFGRNSPLRERAWELLIARYPEYPELVAQHVRLDPTATSRFAATAELFRSGHRPVILVISHALGGGTERHVQEVIERTADQAEYLLLRPTGLGCELSVPAMRGHPVLRLPADRLEDLVTLLRHCGVRRVHIHHLHGYDMDVRRLIHLLDVPFDLSVHDYFGICPRINLIARETGQYCGEPEEAACNMCIDGDMPNGAHDIISWRWKYRWMFAEADRILCPSHDVQRRLARHGIHHRTLVFPHERVTESAWPTTLNSLAPASPLRIAIIGRLAAHKGAEIVGDVATATRPDLFDFVLIGSSEPPLKLPPAAPYRETGAYDETDLDRLIGEVRPHLIWFPAPWPETYSYTLSAAIASGVPIVASDVGAFPERLSGHPWTWLVQPDADAGRWLATFDDARAAVLAGAPPRAAASRPTTEDFFPDAYLAPARGTAPGLPRALRDLRTPGRISVLAVPEIMENGELSPCAYIRVLLPLDHMVQRDAIDLTLATPEDALRYRADVMVCHRYSTLDPLQAEALIAHARQHGMRLLYDLDDDLLNVPESHPEAASLRRRSAVIQRFVVAADTAFASTEPLRRTLLPLQPQVVVVENGLDERLLPHRDVARAPDGAPVGILYMGTATHDADLALVEPALERLMQQFGEGIRIGVMGVTTRADLLPGVSRIGVPAPASQSYPAFLSWLASQTEWHIGIAPLADSDFNMAKSAIKALDYMAMGIAAVVSDVPAYRGLSEDAVLRVRNDPDAWYAALARLVSDPSECQRIATAGRRYLFDQHTLAAQARTRAAAWDAAVAGLRPVA